MNKKKSSWYVQPSMSFIQTFVLLLKFSRFTTNKSASRKSLMKGKIPSTKVLNPFSISICHLMLINSWAVYTTGTGAPEAVGVDTMLTLERKVAESLTWGRFALNCGRSLSMELGSNKETSGTNNLRVFKSSNLESCKKFNNVICKSKAKSNGKRTSSGRKWNKKKKEKKES